MEMALSGLAAASLALALFAWTCQVRLLARRPRRQPAALEGISVLKPLKGVDPGLEENLRSFFLQDHPDLELLFGVQDPSDPAVAVVRRLMAGHPDVRARLVVSDARVGINPKVNNLANIARVAGNDLLLISDSNVRVAPAHVREIAAHATDREVGLVSAPIRAAHASGAGGALESLQMNVFVMGGVAAWSGCLGRPCVVGKSMLLRREILEAVGGWAALGRYLAEDQVCGEEVASLGLDVVVCSRPVDNVLGRVSLGGFVARHLRWARLRSRLSPAGYLAEVLLNPVPLALLAWAAGAGRTCLLALPAMALMSLAAERRLGIRRRALAYLPLELARSLLVAALWPLALAGSRVGWRGNAYRIGRRTRLVPVSPPPAGPVAGAPATSEGAHAA